MRRFRRAKEGAAAVEFGLVALPFFLLTFGLAETAMIGFAQTTLDYAVTETARGIRTGQVQASGMSYAQMQERLCSEMTGILSLDCAGNLYLDVDNYPSYVSIDTTSPISGGNLDTGQFGYNPGGPSSIVVVRAYYRWEVMTPLFQQLYANVGGDERVMVSTMMFRNEPF
ncbi:MAG: TadE/TadG family type IV pilus assembly protein [Hyphomonadaceae bacterium]